MPSMQETQVQSLAPHKLELQRQEERKVQDSLEFIVRSEIDLDIREPALKRK